MRTSSARIALYLCLGVIAVSCSDGPTALPSSRLAPRSAQRSGAPAYPAVVISQIYGGGGNSGATFKNDYIELFNPGTQPVSVAGWSVQYTSGKGTSWAVTNLTGTIQPGAYYLVQEAAGSGGTVSLPTPDATGSIAMSLSNGKVAVVASTTALTGECPATAVDIVLFGTVTSESTCTYAPTGRNLTNTTAAFRGDNGCAFTGNAGDDFTSAAPAPRNSASAPRGSCPVAVAAGPLDHVTIAGSNTVTVGASTQLVATAQDVNNQTVTSANVTWSSSDQSVATVDASGKVSGVSSSPTPVTITATAVDGDITKTASVLITVSSPAIHWIDLSSSSTSFPPGFQTQIFATARVSSGGTVVPANFKFEPVDPQIATIVNAGNTGIISAVSYSADNTKPGFRIIATPLDGATPPDTFITHSITIEQPVTAPAGSYGTNDEFGDPTSASSSNPNDLLISRTQYTLSYNESRGTPNWVSYELDSRQMATGQDRCNCFTADPNLPADKQIFTSDYTSGGFDRGHMARSADRTAANVDNATTYYLTNVVPQMADLNQGVWAAFENFLADSAKAGRAVYIITGPLYSRGKALSFLKNEGKVAIPDSTWKVAFIGPRSADGSPFNRSTMQSWSELANTTVLAVIMPNIAGVRNDPWQKYAVPVDSVESSTGYDFLSLLPLTFQTAVEAGDHSPHASFSFTGTRNEGSALAFDASTSTDPDLGRTDLGRTEALTYVWYFSDGTSATGKTATHTFGNNGTYTANLMVSDAYGWQSQATQTVEIANVAPSVAPLADDTILVGETYRATGSFTDPGADTWTATATYGDGSSAQSLVVGGKTFALSHTYTTAGTFTVTANVNDGDATSSTSGTVVVETAARGIERLQAAVALLAAPTGSLNHGEVNSLEAKLDAAAKQVGKSNGSAANILAAFTNELDALVQSGRLSSATGTQIEAYANRVIASLGT